MKYRQLGASDLEVSVLAFGAWQMGDPDYWGPDEQTDVAKTVNTAIDLGINLFDTAELYGRGESEKELGRALGARRKDVLIATKARWQFCEPARLRKSCEDSLTRLGTDVIDLFQIHWPSRETPFAETYAELERLHEQGKIRAVGVSNFGPIDLENWMAAGSCVSNQLGYNMLFRGIETELVPVCLKHNVGILVYMPLMQGILAGRWKTVEDIPANRRRSRHFSSSRAGARHGEPGCEQMTFETLAGLEQLADRLETPMATVALAWLMAQPGVTSVIVGGRIPAQVERNVAAAELTLSDETVAELNAITEPLRQQLGTNLDLWESEENFSIRSPAG